MAEPILVVGSVAFDDLETPSGKREMCLGGSANYFSVSASLFAPVQLVAVVGEDFPQTHLDLLAARGVDLEGLERAPGKTFRWRGRYAHEGADAETLETQLNVFEHFDPKIPEAYRGSPWVFLGNIHPALQARVLDQIEGPRLVGADTMNFWIEGAREALLAVIARLDLLFINETEARQLAGVQNLYLAADRIREMGPRVLIIKKGSHGGLLLHPDGVFAAPAYPLRSVVDPTGAGDTFAAGVMGWLAEAGRQDFQTLKRAVINGTVLASFACEGFSLDRVLDLSRAEVDARRAELLALVSVA